MPESIPISGLLQAKFRAGWLLEIPDPESRTSSVGRYVCQQTANPILRARPNYAERPPRSGIKDDYATRPRPTGHGWPATRLGDSWPRSRRPVRSISSPVGVHLGPNSPIPAAIWCATRCRDSGLVAMAGSATPPLRWPGSRSAKPGPGGSL
jgi:hypothetical protein